MQFTFTTVNWLLHLAAALYCVCVVLECGCEYHGSSVDAAGGRGSVEKINESLATAAARVI